ncbi:EcsC family protein [Jannaschia aquimarina]|uniref:EcsC protein family protein n=1 Tax=Jannaschia aquimarina TaxID=935700 RepID=A0A0D1CNX7_9RHOB|nr:EcsC family protein [Jannaschia aquimarina]KIT16457.1 EcsC protein family protein [Jannaschia aquimarina]SNS92838.1 EcsC protein family protein [Jannaschia aquimarina]
MKQTVFPPLDRDAELDRLAQVMKGAQGTGFHVLNLIGTQAEGLVDMLPQGVRSRLEKTTISALEYAFDAAKASRGGRLPDTSDWLTRAVTLGTGAAGGFGGVGTALAELPVTTTVILRAIQSIADEHGFDPERPEIRAACLHVFAAAGPLDDDDGTDLSFLTMRLTMTGKSLSGLIPGVAVKLAGPLGQKVAAQAVPVIGAAAGAAINYVFTAYYQDMARVQFGLLALSEQTGESVESLTHLLRARITG